MRNRLSLCLTRLLTVCLTAGFLFAASPPGSRAQTLDLPDFGSSADLVMSSAEERRLGREFMKSVRESLPVIEDPLANDYLESLGNRLIAASGAAASSSTFFLIDDPTINAFAGPGGHIGVFSGLVLTTESESELAAVLAHEIAHVSQRHLMRMFEDQKRLSIPATAALVAAAILGAQINADLGMAAVAGIQAATLQRQINFTRENEQEADRVGIAALATAGFDPYAMPGFFGRLAKASRSSENNAPEFLRTHPVTSNRTADALGRAERFGYRQQPDDLRFHLVRARLRERSFTNPKKAVEFFRSQLQNKRYRNESATRYGYALALRRANRVDAARGIADGLIAAHPNQTEFVILDAQLKAQSGQREQAVKGLQSAVGLRPSNVPLRIAYAEILSASGNHLRALKTLEDLAHRGRGNAAIYELLSDAALKSDQRAATYRYRAEKLYFDGDLEPAIRQLEVALRQPELSYHEASRMQVRLDAMKQEEEEQQKQR